jgi:glycosyltransferase involved in cell wall biosynthesis
MISVLVLTLNEEANIDACLDSVAWSDDVVILDSFSSDHTVELAQTRGRVFQRAFDSFADQRNFGLREIAYKNPWLLMLDADERVPADLRDEMLAATSTARDNVVLFRMRRKDHLFGRWIRRSSGYPTWFGRLARIGRVWVRRPVNEEYHADGELGMLRGHLHHFPFNKGFSAWIAKHDRYSTMEAELRTGATSPSYRLRDALTGDVDTRRRAQKAFAYRLPARPLLMFATLYIVRGGFLEGRAGLTFALLRAWYEYMIDCKCVELERRKHGLPT